MPAKCRHVLVSAFPNLAGLPMVVAGRGWHSLAIEIDGRLIAKFPQDAEAEEALRREASLLATVREHVDLPVPDMTLHEHELLFSLHAKLPGETLDRQGYLALRQVDRQRLAGGLARFFAAMHAIPIANMRAAGALNVDWWDTQPATLVPVWAALPKDVRESARQAMNDYRRLQLDGDVYGFFDAHGWNMAFDHSRGQLNGIFDFADSGIGPREREFVQVSLIHPELAGHAIEAYETATGIDICRRKVFLLTAAQRLSELAGALESGEGLELARDFAVEWFRQDEITAAAGQG